jgi:hypothetical protein
VVMMGMLMRNCKIQKEIIYDLNEN